jgi:hypothetical protein
MACESKFGPDMKNMQKFAWHSVQDMLQYKYRVLRFLVNEQVDNTHTVGSIPTTPFRN